MKAEAFDFGQLGADLRRGLCPRHAAVDLDDVAKLTFERAAARELQRHGGVVVDLWQKLEEGKLHALHIRRRAAVIFPAATVGAQVADQTVNDIFRFAEADPIGVGPGSLGQCMSERPADSDRLTARFRVRDALAVIVALRHHYAQKDHIRPLPIRCRFFSDVAIDQAKRKIVRQIARDGEQTQRRHDRLPPPEEFYRARGIPKSLLGKLRIEH